MQRLILNGFHCPVLECPRAWSHQRLGTGGAACWRAQDASGGSWGATRAQVKATLGKELRLPTAPASERSHGPSGRDPLRPSIMGNAGNLSQGLKNTALGEEGSIFRLKAEFLISIKLIPMDRPPRHQSKIPKHPWGKSRC